MFQCPIMSLCVPLCPIMSYPMSYYVPSCQIMLSMFSDVKSSPTMSHAMPYFILLCPILCPTMSHLMYIFVQLCFVMFKHLPIFPILSLYCPIMSHFTSHLMSHCVTIRPIISHYVHFNQCPLCPTMVYFVPFCPFNVPLCP